MTSATDELRRMLDERGVEWGGEFYESCTFWNDETNLAVASEDIDGKLWVSQSVTPEQAIEATLGRGTCKDVGRYCFSCSECGWVANEPHHVLGGFWPNYCPNCGRKVVED